VEEEEEEEEEKEDKQHHHRHGLLACCSWQRATSARTTHLETLLRVFERLHPHAQPVCVIVSSAPGPGYPVLLTEFKSTNYFEHELDLEKIFSILKRRIAPGKNTKSLSVSELSKSYFFSQPLYKLVHPWYKG
jgi:hypothetical protein